MLIDQAEQRENQRKRENLEREPNQSPKRMILLVLAQSQICYFGGTPSLIPLFGYYLKPTKCWLIVKPRMKDMALKTFENTGTNLTEDGKHHLGAVIGSIEYRENYVTQIVNAWLDELNMLCDIARIESQAAYSCFVSGYKHKLTYIMRTIPNISHQLEKTDGLILTKFILAITDGIYVNPVEHYLFSLTAKYGGLGIPIFSQLAGIEFQNSQIMSEDLQNKTIEQERASSQQHGKKIKENKNNIEKSKQSCHHTIVQRLQNDMSDEQRRLNEIN